MKVGVYMDDEAAPLYPFRCEMLIFAHSALHAAELAGNVGIRSTISVKELDE